jgi:hypothetical protein
MPKLKSETVQARTPVTPQAVVTTTKQEVLLIVDPLQVEQGLKGLLQLGGKTILVCRGGDTSQVIRQVYSKFQSSKDARGEPFKFSRRLRGLVHHDKIWDAPRRVSGQEFLNYLNAWFVPCQLLSNPSGPALLILPEVPPLFGATAQQTRFSGSCAELFTFID